MTRLWCVGSKRNVGWIIGLGVQSLWAAYAVCTRQWGFLVSAGAYAVVNARNLRQWRYQSSPSEAS